ncbi:Rhodopsin orphan GPCR [Schistosoma japonicum]|nr:Rhodopsin orphan GPCR [Schistosoma japonicum]
MIEANETFRLNCTARYLLNESNIDPISIFDRYPQCELQRKFMPIFLYIVRTFMLIWLISGLFGNFISFIIWISKQQRRKNSSAIYLAALSLTDLILILLLLNYDLERYWCVRGVTIIPGICQIFQCLFIFTQYYSIVLVFGFTLERYLAVCFPFKRHKLCTTQRAILAVIILSLFIIGPTLSQAILWTFENGECQSSQFISATLMLIILSFYLIACTVPTGIVYLIQFRWLQPDDCLTDNAIHQSNEWTIFFQRITTKGLIDALCASHYACNFFIYFLTCNGFKKQALNILKCKFTRINYHSDYATETLILSRLYLLTQTLVILIIVKLCVITENMEFRNGAKLSKGVKESVQTVAQADVYKSNDTTSSRDYKMIVT